MAPTNIPGPTKYPVQYIKNLSFDEDFRISAVELLGYDSDAQVLRRIKVDSNGNVVTSGTSPIASPFVTIGNDATLTGERALTGTTNQITITDNGANSTAVVSLPSDVIIDSPNIVVTTTQAFALRNDTDSTSGVTAQWSPAFDFHGHAWKSGLGAADRDVRVRMESQTQTSAGTPFSYLTIKSSTDTGTPSWTNNFVLATSKTLVDQSVSGAAANTFMHLDSIDTVSSAGFGSTPGFSWLKFSSNGTLRGRFDWSAGSSLRFFGNGRIDVESTTQIYFTAPSGFFMQSNTSINRAGDATGTATQKNSYILEMQSSLWTGSASVARYAQLRATASTTVNLDYSLVTYMGGNDGNAVGTEVMRVFWDDSVSRALIGIGVTAPTAALHLRAGTTAAENAPLKFTSGSLQTAAEAGAMEFLTDKLYFTRTSGTPDRMEIVLDHATEGTTITSGLVRTAEGGAVDLTVRGGIGVAGKGETNGRNVTLAGGLAGGSATVGGLVKIYGGGANGGTGGSWATYRSNGTTKQIEGNDTGIGFFAATPVAQPSSTGELTGFTANTSVNNVFNESTFTGNSGTKAYTISDIVKHLKVLGLLATS